MKQGMGFDDWLAGPLDRVRAVMAKALASEVSEVRALMGELGRYEGKLLRPTLVLLSGRACGEIGDRHYVMGAMVELIHMATLVHDDVLDEAQCRRGGVSVNRLYGNEAAVLLGDLLVSRAFELCGQLADAAIWREVTQATRQVCEGELMQLSRRGIGAVNEADYMEIVLRKTASLMGSSCYLGAVGAGAEAGMCEALVGYGEQLGTAFQIVDDITDVAGDEEATGKTLGTDIEKGKLTLPVIHYLTTGGAEAGQWLAGMMERSDWGLAARQALAGRLAQSGSLAYARTRAADCVARAQASLPEGCEELTRGWLCELAEGVLT